MPLAAWNIPRCHSVKDAEEHTPKAFESFAPLNTDALLDSAVFQPFQDTLCTALEISCRCIADRIEQYSPV